MDACVFTWLGLMGLGGVLLLIRTHLTRRCPLFYCAPGRRVLFSHRFS